MGSNPEIFFLNVYFLKHERWLQARAIWKLKSMMALSSRQIGHHTISDNITASIHQKLKKGGAKVADCKFCDKTFSGCCTTRATAHILGCPVLGQTKAGIQSCIAINKKR